MRGYLTREGDGFGDTFTVTPTGVVALERLIAARRDQLCQLLEGWPAATDADTEHALDRMARALVAEIPEEPAIQLPS